ncbi:dTDP-4-dehydrorhamnose reductase [Paenibacillus glycanilyticus]|uniref:dTDP-4-dehydrorhamnose reductase n=1 Tax=Paenibacillus glycanilyticus TaxID=126569 RepID=UPI00203B510A|nr:dTDP-4-dehydrorhamnose reductase [Paenibacillus glycanilyticus]MCM3629394.1 dTDP-4-dehydrorhamnose reductase [Paenibacillus glycanilyticus]
MKVAVTGANGQLGRELVMLETGGRFDIIGLGRTELDITNLEQCRSVLSRLRPDVVIHCAAYTAVDRAEAEPDEAFRINAAGSRNVAVAAREIGAKLCAVSTDYVFDGAGAVPYKEYDRTNPQTVYGQSKLAGEQAVSSLHDRYFIVRTSWVFGAYGNNFVKTMLKLSSERDKLTVVADQWGSPTYTRDLAIFLLELAETDYYGIYHASNNGVCSWYEFAQAIMEESGCRTQVAPCTTAEFPRPAPRPHYSVMDHSAIRSNGLTPLRHWREALKHYLSNNTLV